MTAHASITTTTQPRVRGTLVAACCAVLVAQLANALPASLNGLFQSELNATGTQLVWITTSFLIAVVVFELTFGALGDLFGRRRLQLLGGVVLVAGSLICLSASSVWVLCVGMALNGLGAGAMYPASLSLVAAVTHTPASRAKGIALWAGCLSLGAALSPLVGGAFAQLTSWRGSFAVVVGLALITVVLTTTRSAESIAPERRRLDLPGQVTFAVGLIALLAGLTQGGEDGWTNPFVLVLIIGGLICLGAFVAVERRTTNPLLDLGLFRIRSFTVASIVTVVAMFAFLASAYSFSIWLGAAQRQPSARVGVPLLLQQAPAFLLIPVIGWLLARVNARWLLSAGCALLGVGALLAARMEITNLSLVPVIAPSLFIGIGFALAVSSITAVAINAVPLHLAGMASATTNLLRDLGFVLGPIVGGAVSLGVSSHALLSSLGQSGLPADQVRAATAVATEGGALAVNGLASPAPGSAAHPVALQAISDGLTATWTVAAIAALAAAVLTVVGLSGRGTKTPSEEALHDPLHPELPGEPLTADGAVSTKSPAVASGTAAESPGER